MALRLLITVCNSQNYEPQLLFLIDIFSNSSSAMAALQQSHVNFNHSNIQQSKTNVLNGILRLHISTHCNTQYTEIQEEI